MGKKPRTELNDVPYDLYGYSGSKTCNRCDCDASLLIFLTVRTTGTPVLGGTGGCVRRGPQAMSCRERH